MELLQFVFSSFWVWLGCVVLIVAAGEAVATAAAAETCRGAQSSEPLKSSIVCLWKNLWTVWITGNAC